MRAAAPTRTPRGAALAFALAIFTPAAAPAQARPDFIPGGILTGHGPDTVRDPQSQPYFLGWSAEVTEAAGLLQQPFEPGGVEVDPRSGWVYATSRRGRIVCYDRGRLKWSVDVGGSLLAPPAVHRELLVVPTAEGVLHVLNKVTGERKARAILGEELVTQPVVVEVAGAPRAYVGSSFESVFAVELELGQKLWRAHRDAPSGFTIRGFARPVATADAVFAGYADGVVQALDPATGAAKWEKRVSPPGEFVDVDALATNGNLLFVASYSGGVYALDPASGSTAWRTAMPGASRLKVDGPSVFVGVPGALRALQAGDGKQSWEFRLGVPRTTTTPVVSEGLVAIAELDGPLYFVDRRTGTPEGAFGTGDGFAAAPAVTGNVIYALSNGGRIYSLAVVP